MRKLTLLILFLTTTLLASACMSKASSASGGEAVAYWYAVEKEERSNIILDSSWLEFRFKRYKNWVPDKISVEIYADLMLEKSDKIESDGYLYYAYKENKYNLFIFVNMPGRNSIKIRAKKGYHIYIKNMTIYYRYVKIEKVKYVDSGDIRTLKLNVEFEKIKENFDNFHTLTLDIFWPGSFELTELYNPAGTNVLEISDEYLYIYWLWNGLFISFTQLSKIINVNGTWVIKMKKYDESAPFVVSYPNISAYMQLSLIPSVHITLRPRSSKVLKIRDILSENLPPSWHIGLYYSHFSVWVKSGSPEDLKIRNVINSRRYGDTYYVDMYRDDIILENTGSSTLKLVVNLYLAVYTRLNTKTYFGENNKSEIRVVFELPPRDSLNVGKTTNGAYIVVFHGGLWKPGSLYTPDGRPAQSIMDEKSWFKMSSTYYSAVSVSQYLHFDTYVRNTYYPGKWTYTAYAPTIYLIDNGSQANLSAPYLTNYIHREDGAMWAHYSIGERAKFYVENQVVQVDSGTRLVFERWKGYGGGFDSEEPIGSFQFDDVFFLKEVAVWNKEYLLSVDPGKGEVSGSGWYREGETAVLELSETEITPTEGVRYVFVGWAGDTSGKDPKVEVRMDGPKNVKAMWKAQYYVRVKSDHGSVRGEGWYDNGSITDISVSPLEVGFPVRNVFKYWLVNGKPVYGSTIPVAVNGPVLAVAVWERDYTYLALIALLTVGLVLITVWLFMRRRKKKPQYYYPMHTYTNRF